MTKERFNYVNDFMDSISDADYWRLCRAAHSTDETRLEWAHIFLGESESGITLVDIANWMSLL